MIVTYCSPQQRRISDGYLSKPHKQLQRFALTLYQIQWKFRDEIRPRFGVMKVENSMKDGYNFDQRGCSSFL